MKILVAPLDWGLGHATRCIPLIEEFLQQGDEVIVAAEGNVESILRKEFPGIKFVFLRGYRIRYSAALPMSLSIFFRLPGMLRRIFIEHQQLKKLIREHHSDAVVSDNRYGLWNKKIKSIFITHQVMIKCPVPFRFMERFVYSMHKYFISRYDECWIPDSNAALSGDLSHKYRLPANAKMIGILSRWKKSNEQAEKKFDVAAIISGPEPHRALFEKLLIRELTRGKLRSVIVLGKPGEQSDVQLNEYVRSVSHLPADKLLEIISGSGSVICRSGYSSIMDMVAAGKDAILIPTPGQTEQLYLARHLKKNKVFFSIDQKNFNVANAIVQSKKYSVKNFTVDASQLRETVASWKKKSLGGNNH